ncbi:MAG TPA: methyltransferase domain-containing protein [Mycobacteriales bacterium]|jgi:tRNA (mo5U34)-methyltransferase|nr:methyltransferase domain-containing protein [Mycobacteriales bacterium]
MPEPSEDELRAAVGEREWYHTIELRPGLVTPGWFDTRTVAGRLPWPDLTGRRCLDVGTFDGFWALEMERRGASQVTAIDILDPRQWDWPAGSDEETVAAIGRRKGEADGFSLVVGALGSAVERRELSVYDLDPDVVGRFDFVYVGSLLLHLRDPVRALGRVAGVLRPGGRVLLVDAIDISLTRRHPRRPVARLDGIGRPWWWYPNAAALGRMVSAAGLRIDSGPKPFRMVAGSGHTGRPWRHLVGNATARRAFVEAHLGEPHAWVVASLPDPA